MDDAVMFTTSNDPYAFFVMNQADQDMMAGIVAHQDHRVIEALRQGANPNLTNPGGKTAFALWVQLTVPGSDDGVFEAMMRCPGGLTAETIQQAFVEAAGHHHGSWMKRLIKVGATPKDDEAIDRVVSEDGSEHSGPSSKGSRSVIETLRWLIDQGATVDPQDLRRTSALKKAVVRSATDRPNRDKQKSIEHPVIEFLLDQGADPFRTVQDRHSNPCVPAHRVRVWEEVHHTPMQEAIERGDAGMVRTLLKAWRQRRDVLTRPKGDWQDSDEQDAQRQQQARVRACWENFWQTAVTRVSREVFDLALAAQEDFHGGSIDTLGQQGPSTFEAMVKELRNHPSELWRRTLALLDRGLDPTLPQGINQKPVWWSIVWDLLSDDPAENVKQDVWSRITRHPRWDVNAGDDGGNTFAHDLVWMVLSDHQTLRSNQKSLTKAMKMWLNQGGDLNRLNGQGVSFWTALWSISLPMWSTKSDAISEMLDVVMPHIDWDAHWGDVVPRSTKPAILNAFFEWGGAAAERLWEASWSVDQTFGQEERSTLLHEAVKTKKISWVQRVVEKGACLDAPNGEGETASDVARRLGEHAIAVYLEQIVLKKIQRHADDGPSDSEKIWRSRL